MLKSNGQIGMLATPRNRNLDAYRCILMLLIVVHHVSFFSYGLKDVQSGWVMFFFTTLTYWHVDGFMSLTGWYGTKFSLLKASNLLGVILFYSFLGFLYSYFVRGLPIRGSICVTGGWFGNAYLAFLFVVPFINAAISKILEESKRRRCVIWLAFNLCFILGWFPFRNNCIQHGLGGV